MIKRACRLRAPLSGLTKIKPELPELSDEEWKLLEAADRVLGIFEYTTQKLSAASYPTLNIAVRVYNHLFDKLEDLRKLCSDEVDGQDDETGDEEVDEEDYEEDQEEADSQAENDEEDKQDKGDDKTIINQCSPAMKRTLKSAIQAAHRKMREYYGKTWADMYMIALILDPRLKMDYFEDNHWEEEHVAHAKGAIQQAVKMYGDAMPRSEQSGTARRLDPVDEELHQQAKRRRVNKESELWRYSAAPTADADVDVLEWWKCHTRKYPWLARIARDYLGIPATSAPAERVFSDGADLITKKRGSLCADTIQACMCLKSWL
jgi:hypothetical protein